MATESEIRLAGFDDEIHKIQGEVQQLDRMLVLLGDRVARFPSSEVTRASIQQFTVEKRQLEERVSELQRQIKEEKLRQLDPALRHLSW